MKALTLAVVLTLVSAISFGSPTKGKYFDRVIFVVFENTSYATAIQQPFFKKLAASGANFTNFTALTHPSQGNYIALTSGDTEGVTNDNQYDLNVSNVVDLLEAKGITWKVYAESFPENCFQGMKSGNYYRKHNPFMSFVDIQNNPARCSHIVNAQKFSSDLQNGDLPEYIFYVPDIQNDGHNTGVTYADAWYGKTFGPFLNDSRLMDNAILISTFDEGSSGPKNRIYTSIVGPAVNPGNYADNLTTPSLLRLVEENWSLGDLGKLDASATAITNIWK